MKKRGLLLTLTSVMLLCSCGGTTYTIEEKSEKDNIKSETSDKLVLGKDTFTLEKYSYVVYGDGSKMAEKYEGTFTVKEKQIYKGTYTVSDALLGGTVYTLNSESVKAYTKVSGKGAEKYKAVVEATYKLLGYSSQEIVDILDGKTVSRESSATYTVKLDEENKTFSYSLLGL